MASLPANPLSPKTRGFVRSVYSELGRSATAKLIGIRPSRLDKWLEGRGKTSLAESRRAGFISRNVRPLRALQNRARLEGRSEVKTNKALKDLIDAKGSDTKKARRSVVDALIRLGVPGSGPASVYLDR